MGIYPQMMEKFSRYWKDEGIVIHSTNLGEQDRLVTLFTRERGKIRALAKGARKVGNRFGASLDVFNLSQFMFYSGAGMPIITQGVIKLSYRALVSSVEKWLEGSYVLYLLDQCWQWGKPEEGLLDRVVCFWETILERGDDIYPFFLRFKLDLAFYLGISPHLESCVLCHRGVEGESYWSHAEGGLICSSCSGKGQEKIVFPQDLRAILRYLSSPGENYSPLRLSLAQFKELDKILSDYLSYQGGRKIMSWHDFRSFRRRDLVVDRIF